MWEPENSLQRILDEALADAPYRIAAKVISERASTHGVEMTELEREKLVEHLKRLDGERFVFGDASHGHECTRVELTDADVALFSERLERFVTDGAPAVIASAVEETAELMLAHLHESWAEESDGQRLELDGFKERLHRRWGEAIDLLRMLLTVSREFGELVSTTARGAEEQESPVLTDVLLRLHARSCQVTDEIVCLLSAGFSDGAIARWRTLHEISAVALFLREHGEQVAQRYVDHEVVESARVARDYDECCEQLRYEAMGEAELEAVRQRHEAVVAKYGPEFDRPYGWAADALGLKKPTLGDLRKGAGIDHMRAHYRLASHNVHANPNGLFTKLGLLGDIDVLLTGPSNAGLSEPGQNAAISLMQVCSALGTLGPTMDTNVVLHILMRLTNEVCEAFHTASEQLERDELAGQ